MDGTAGRAKQVIDVNGVDDLIHVLGRQGFTVIGPVEQDGAIRYAEVTSVAQLPAGRGDTQDGGMYRLRERGDQALFGYAVGPDSFKRYLLPPSVLQFRSTRAADGLTFDEPADDPPRHAFLGARPCDLAAIATQDRVLTGGPRADSDYASNRENLFLVVAQCGAPSGACFCASMDTGPRAEEGFDLALTELLDGDHRFLVEVGSAAGAEVLAQVRSLPASAADRAAAATVTEGCVAGMGRRLDTDGLHDDLLANLTHPQWDDIADRCLSCANCTMVCPTCFCTGFVDATNPAGQEATRTRVWDSCFTVGFSHIHGGAIRSSVTARYRQWMTHKLATWIDQFGTSGCVGCGRCITWCPVGIDLTEEAAKIRTPPTEAARGVR
jgi:sulfhydrogenase subunit beta (sulfur reductase)